MIDSLIPKSEFIGLETDINLAAGGESPMLKSHQDAIQQFMRDKSRGELARKLEADKFRPKSSPEGLVLHPNLCRHAKRRYRLRA